MILTLGYTAKIKIINNQLKITNLRKSSIILKINKIINNIDGIDFLNIKLICNKKYLNFSIPNLNGFVSLENRKQWINYRKNIIQKEFPKCIICMETRKF